MSETSVANDTSSLIPQRQKASDYDDSDPVPQIQNVLPSADTTVLSQQELDLLFGPLYDGFFNAACKKNTDSLNSEIADLNEKLSDSKNMLYYYKLRLSQVEARLVEFKNQEIKFCNKIRGLEFKRYDKNKEGLGYSVVPPPPTQVYSPLKKDMSWTGLLEFADDIITDYSRLSSTIESNSDDLQNKNSSVTETRESSSTISSKPEIKFVKAVDKPTEIKTNKVETVKKHAVKYAKMYKKTSKSSNVKGNQRNWNRLKSQQLGKNFLMKNKACFNYGEFDHLSYDCGKWVDQGKT
nr:ubiquitin hydrolase [Tanacetum cinerariifolium]